MFAVAVILSLFLLQVHGFILRPTSQHESFGNVNSSQSIEGHYRHASVASDNAVCSTIGADIMSKRSGSAVDAAIATLVCLGVADAMSTGIGGGHFMTIYERKTRKVYSIISREMAPAAASTDMFTHGKSSEEGGLAIGVPGELMGMWQAHQIGGSLPWADLFTPTVNLCEQGVPVAHPLASAIQSTKRKGFFQRYPALKTLLTNPSTGDYYKTGEKIKRPKLAATLRRVAAEGVSAYYNGSLSATIVKEIADAGGIVTLEDLKRYTSKVTTSLQIKLPGDMTAYAPPPPSSGAVLLYILNILKGYNFVPADISSADSATLTYHRIIEAFKFAYAKRSALGDGDGEDETFRKELDSLIKNMTSTKFADDIRSQIVDSRTGNIQHYGPSFQVTDDHGTTHMSVIGPNGDAVAITSTINLYFGSKVVGEHTGIIYNDEMDDFSTPDTVNAFGVPASPANFIKPGKRPLSSMCPTIITGPDGHVVLVVGASGGTKITTASALVSMNALWFNRSIKESIDYPRVHHQLSPNEVVIERGFPTEIINGLKAKGHKVSMTGSAGSVVQGILQRQEGIITANSDYRKYGRPDGY